jgi:hypothetical protein
MSQEPLELPGDEKPPTPPPTQPAGWKPDETVWWVMLVSVVAAVVFVVWFYNEAGPCGAVIAVFVSVGVISLVALVMTFVITRPR